MSLSSSRLASSIQAKILSRIESVQTFTDAQKAEILSVWTDIANAIVAEITSNADVMMLSHTHTGVATGTAISGPPPSGQTESIV